MSLTPTIKLPLSQKLNALLDYRCWGLWKPPSKRPIRVRDLRNARTNEAADWAEFDEAVATLQDGYGLGLCLLGLPIIGIDLDHCRDLETGLISEFASAIFEMVEGAYVEISPSGTGFHILGDGAGAQSCQTKHGIFEEARFPKASIELYSNTARFLTITGAEYEPTKSRPCALDDPPSL